MSSIVMPSVFPVTCHTDFVGLHSIFVVIEGYSDNGLNYAKKAIDKGARTVVIQSTTVLADDLQAYIKRHNVVVKRVDDARAALADLSAQHAGFPSKKLKVIAVTGTKGKTTSSFLLEHVLKSAGYKTALISSAENHILDHKFTAPLTTPQPDYLQQFLKICSDHNVDYVVMEVAAQALSLHRVKGIEFDGIIFTNFSHEHLEFYATLEDYFQAKCLIFNSAKSNAPILTNLDNDHGARIYHKYQNVIGYGFTSDNAHYKGVYCVEKIDSVELSITILGSTITVFCPALLGEYNAYNILSVIGMALELQVSREDIIQAVQSFGGVPGRLQYFLLPNGARSCIDYAHNPESFRAVLSALRLLTKELIVVFGSGGGRDKIKRPLMGAIAANIADIVVLTSDNPRLEDAIDIVSDISSGVSRENSHKILCVLDRKEAIEKAYSLSSKGSIIALLGKGPDEYQIIGKTKYYFSERSIIQQLQ